MEMLDRGNRHIIQCGSSLRNKETEDRISRFKVELLPLNTQIQGLPDLA